MKLAFCISQLTKGGAERVVTNLANYLSSKHDVTIISLRNESPAYKISDKVKVIFLDDIKKNKISKNIYRFKKLKNIYLKNNYDIILSFLPEPCFFTIGVKKFSLTKRISSKIIVSVRNDPKIEYRSILYKFFMKLLYKRANGFVFQTEDARNYFSKSIQKKSTIILNSLNPDFITEPFRGKRDDKVVSVGRLDKQKNQKMLIQAFYCIHKKYPNYKLYIFGEGPLREELSQLICKLKLDKCVFLPGVSDNIKEEIYNAKLFVLSSNYEGLPNSLMEAMTLGLPCISTDCPCGGPKSLIDDGQNGILTEVNNIEMLEEKMDYLLKNDDYLKKIGNEARKIIHKIDPKIINSKWEEYIKKIYLEGDFDEKERDK